MSPRWKALRQCGEDVARIEPLAGGVANDMWSVRVGHLAVGRGDECQRVCPTKNPLLDQGQNHNA